MHTSDTYKQRDSIYPFTNSGMDNHTSRRPRNILEHYTPVHSTSVRLFIITLFTGTIILLPCIAERAFSQNIGIPTLQIGVTPASGPGQVATAMEILFLLTVLSLAPAILIMLTSFTRTIIVLSFLKQAIGTQHMPSNQLMAGLALFLTFFIMSPVFKAINNDALQPYLNNKIDYEKAIDQGMIPIRKFMLSNTREKDLSLFIHLTKGKKPNNQNDISTSALIPSFIISELKTAFEMGFFIFIPFLIIDLVVASVLLSMGMMMLPPVMISMPFKLLLFIMVDGWYLVIGSLAKSFTK